MIPLRRRRSAFTLIELIFAMAIGAVVVAGLYTLFSQQMKQFMYQDLNMQMHQNVRLGMDVLTRTARLAGFGTSGWANGEFGFGGNDDNSMPALLSYDGMGPNGSDAITIVSMDPALVMNSKFGATQACDTTALMFDTSTAGYAAKLAQYQAGDVILCSDYAAPGGTRSFLWQLSADGDASTGQISINAATQTDYSADCEAGDDLPVILTCSRAEVATFYIDASESDGVGAGSSEHPVLMMDLDFESPDDDDVPLVDDIEDMQFRYCFVDTDCTSSSSWEDNLSTDSTATNAPQNVQMIRITLVARSPRPDPSNLFGGARVDVENNTGNTGSTDHYFRQVLTSEVTVRNLRMQGIGG
jgi:prepilin-type N-terminal cleavage/methylation domain-containing protein